MAIPLDFSQQFSILALMLLASKGAATVSGGSFVVFAATVTATGILPLRAWPFCSVLTGLCRSRSRPNVIGNSIATVVTAKLCGEFDQAALILPRKDST
ncbi:MAG: cation:dicarboxylate symporter family transporter [Bradyrhizobium sp.]